MNTNTLCMFLLQHNPFKRKWISHRWILLLLYRYFENWILTASARKDWEVDPGFAGLAKKLEEVDVRYKSIRSYRRANGELDKIMLNIKISKYETKEMLSFCGKILNRDSGFFIAPKCVKSQNQLPFHTMKYHLIRQGIGKKCAWWVFEDQNLERSFFCEHHFVLTECVCLFLTDRVAIKPRENRATWGFLLQATFYM